MTANSKDKIFRKMLDSSLGHQYYDTFKSNGSDLEPPSDETEFNENQEQQQINEVMEMVIDLDNQHSVTLLIQQKDDPTTLAKKFCFKHNVDPRVIPNLTKNIQNVQSLSFAKHKNNPHQNQSKARRGGQSTYFDDKENQPINHSSFMHNTSLEKANHTTSKKNNVSFQQNTTMISQNPNHVSATAYNVFDRLYQDSKKKKHLTNTIASEQPTSKRNQKTQDSMSRDSILNQSSIHQQLYQKNTKLKEQTNRKNQQLFEQKQQSELQGCAFKPKINPISNLIVNKMRYTDPNSDRKMTQSQQKQIMKIREYLKQKELKEMKECTFEPKILDKSRKSVNKTERFLLLHDDHNLRETKKRIIHQQLEQQVQIKSQPQINKISDYLVQGKHFYQRLQQNQNKRLKRKQSLEFNQQIIARPSTGRAPISRNKGDKTIGEYLYQKSKQKKRINIQQQKKVFTCKKSEAIHEENKKNAFRYLFALMDNDEDGMISGVKISIGNLQQNILRLMAPLLSEMEEQNVELNEDEFIEAFSKLYKTLAIHEKNQILNAYKKNFFPKDQEPSFQPLLNQKSIGMSREIRIPGVDLYQLSQEHQTAKLEKLAELRMMRMLEESEQCTFHPNLFR